MSRNGMNGRNQKLTLDRLEGLLDAYGGNPSRWPERLAPEAHALIASSNEARRLHAEALALDRLLAKASAPDPKRLETLARRIVAAAEREGFGKTAETGDRREAGPGARVIPMPVNARAIGNRKPAESQVLSAAAASRPSRGRLFGDSWPAAAALAASLAFGFAIGFSDIAPTATYNVASLVQPAASDADAVLSELHIDTLNAFDEDQI